MSLPETREELIESIQQNLSSVTLPLKIAKLGFELEEAAAWLQALGICNLLLYADADRFYENLVRSGHTRRFFLSKSRDEGNIADLQLAISRWDSFLDVVVAGHFTLARDIVAQSADDWVRTGEYEDDFCYRHFLHWFVMPPAPEREAHLNQAIARWRAWLGGQASVRLDCCGALLGRDAAAFAKAFDQLIADRQAQVLKQKKTTLASDIGFLPRSQIFVEGLALLRLAERVGFPLRTDYPLCPALARLPPGQPWPDDVFPILEAERGNNAAGTP